MPNEQELRREIQVKEARGGSSKAERAAILYARAEGLSGEAAADRAQALEELNALIAEMTARDWQEIPKYWALLGEAGLCGLMRHAVEASVAESEPGAATLGHQEQMVRNC